jgi:hypothetical protein
MKYVVAVVLLSMAVSASADEKKTQGAVLEFSKGTAKLTMVAPGEWETKKPKVSIIRYEFLVKPAKGDDKGARLTMMQAGGSVGDNVARWKTQFKLPTGEAGEKAVKQETKEIGSGKVHFIDIAGTYKDRPAPFSQNIVLRKDYRMFGAIILQEPIGQVFLKMYGPEKTMEANKKAFISMVENLKFEE